MPNGYTFPVCRALNSVVQIRHHAVISPIPPGHSLVDELLQVLAPEAGDTLLRLAGAELDTRQLTL